MLKKRLAVIYIVTGLSLASCSSETSAPQDKAVNNAKRDENEVSSSAAGVRTPVAADDQPAYAPPEAPTRSELRVAAEQAKITEEKAQDYIEQLDANLSNPQMRKETQERFKKLLPDYKEKMLQLGKAKLKQEAHSK